MLAHGSNTDGRNLRFDPPEYGSRGWPRGAYVVRKGAIPQLPCREDLLRGAEAPRMEPRRIIRTPNISLSRAASMSQSKLDAKRLDRGSGVD